MNSKRKNTISVSDNYREQYLINPNFCECCEKELPYSKRHNKFCNSSCSASKNNKARAKTSKRICLNCNNPLNRGKKYCSNICQIEYERNAKIELMLSGKQVPFSINTIRSLLVEIHEGSCQSCGLNEWLGKNIPLEVHHIDGNHKNNTIANLEILCPNCHAFTDNYKNRNNHKSTRTDRASK